MTSTAITEQQLDSMANDGRLTRLAMQMAIDARADWPSLDGDAQDAWHERAIEQLRGIEPMTDYDKWRAVRRHGSNRTPWDDCKIAFGIDNDEPFDDDTIRENLSAGRGLPRGWVLDEVDGTGARWVAVFRVTGLPTAYAGKRVRSVLRTIGALK